MSLKLRPPSDGYSFPGTWDGSPFGLPSVRYTFRPAAPEVVEEYRIKIGTVRTGKDSHDARCEIIIGRVYTWDVLGEDGKPATVSKEILSHCDMPTPLIDHLVAAATGYTDKKQAADLKN